MRRLTEVAFAAAALTLVATGGALAGSATPQIADGFVSIAAGGANVTSDPAYFSSNGLSVEGTSSAEYNFSATLGFQGDLVLRSQDYNIDSNPTVNDRSLDLALHAFYRDDRYLAGAFAQGGYHSVSEYPYLSETFDNYFAGVEGQTFLGNLTLYGQAGGEQLALYNERINGAFANFEARYFLTPNMKIEGHVGIDSLAAQTDIYFPGVTTWHAGIGAEFRLPDKPFSFFAKYDFAHLTLNNSSQSVNDNRILVGAKFNFGTDTLMQRDRSGASLKPVEMSLPYFFYTPS